MNDPFERWKFYKIEAKDCNFTKYKNMKITAE